MGESHAPRSRQRVRPARAAARPHGARPAPHLRFGRGLAMAIEGPLRELGIHDVFQLLDLSRKTGALRVTSELRHNAGTINFEEGVIVFATIRTNPHPLGGLLIRTGKITEADLERARDMQQRQGDKRRLGEILVSLGAITTRELQRQVRFQIEEVAFEIMSWQEGYFSFSEGELTDTPADALVRIPVEALMMEGARRIDEWSRIEKRIPHLGIVPTLAPAATEGGDLDLLPAEWEVLALIDGQRDVRGIAGELGRSDFDIAKTLFGLERAGVIILHDPGTAQRGRPGPAADLAELVARGEAALEAKDVDGARRGGAGGADARARAGRAPAAGAHRAGVGPGGQRGRRAAPRPAARPAVRGSTAPPRIRARGPGPLRRTRGNAGSLGTARRPTRRRAGERQPRAR